MGDRVWLHEPATKRGLTKKLRRPWCGPYVVKKKVSDIVYEIQKEGGRTCKVVHFNRLKPCACSGTGSGETETDILRNPGRSVPRGNSLPPGAPDQRQPSWEGEDLESVDSSDEDQLVAEPHDKHLLTPPPTPIGNQHPRMVVNPAELSPEQMNQPRLDQPEEVEEFDDEMEVQEEDDEAEDISHVVRRSARRKRLPAYLKDFDCD